MKRPADISGRPVEPPARIRKHVQPLQTVLHLAAKNQVGLVLNLKEPQENDHGGVDCSGITVFICRDLLRVLTKEELSILERRLCTTESGSHPCGEDPELLPGADTPEQYEGSLQGPHASPSPVHSSVTHSNIVMGSAPDALASGQRSTCGLQYPCSDNDLFPGMSSAQPGCDVPEAPPVAFAASAAPCTVPPRAAGGGVPGSELWVAPHVGDHSGYTHTPPEVDLSASAVDVRQPLHRLRQNWRGQTWHPKQSCPGAASIYPGREGRRSVCPFFVCVLFFFITLIQFFTL